MSAAEGRLIWERDGRDWPNREASRFIEAGGLKWHVQQMGSGPLALLIHGTAASTHSWAKLMPMLAERFTVIAPDLPGHGFTDPLPRPGMTLPGIGEALSFLLRALKAEPDFAIGQSAGAAILARMILDRRILPRLFISLNGALTPFPGAAGHIFPAMAKLLFLNSLTPKFFAWRARDPRAVERVIAQTGSHVSPDRLTYYQRLFRSPAHVGAALAMMANWDLAGLARELPGLPCPILLVTGSNDLAVLPDQAFRLAKAIPGANVELVRGLGHLMHEEDPRRLADIVIKAAESLTAQALTH
jgi:magnesium chelatase accessory protein